MKYEVTLDSADESIAYNKTIVQAERLWTVVGKRIAAFVLDYEDRFTELIILTDDTQRVRIVAA